MISKVIESGITTRTSRLPTTFQIKKRLETKQRNASSTRPSRNLQSKKPQFPTKPVPNKDEPSLTSLRRLKDHGESPTILTEHGFSVSFQHEAFDNAGLTVVARAHHDAIQKARIASG